jgi:two-component system sensor histidine kinase UhpB
MTVAVFDKPALKSSPPGSGLSMHGLVLRALRVPLLLKLIGANALLLAGGLVAHALWPDASMVLQLSLTVGLSFAVSAMLVWLALRPLATLEEVAVQVSDGNFAARVPMSRLADRDMLKLSGTMNRLLERVETDRARIQYLAGRAVRARDIERESVARELRDSLAQLVSAAALQLSVARSANADPVVDEQLRAASSVISQITDEMKLVAESLYPGTLGELGLQNALHSLARRVGHRGRLRIDVDAGLFDAPLSAQAASALYRVADEALRNVAQHADARHARILLSSNGHVLLEVEDDGRGMDLRRRDPVQAGLGLFSARAVLALAGGELQISSAPGLGTRVVARVPVTDPGTDS